MIQANELRIGNVISFEGMECIIKEIDEQGVVVFIKETDETIWIDLFQFQPIEITEEILLKCGFKFEKHYYCIYINEYSEFIIAQNNGENIYYLCDIDINVNIKYLHQLQNIYWCLTNEELTINL